MALGVARDCYGLPAVSGALLGGGATANIVVAIADRCRRRRWVARCHRRDGRTARARFLAAFTAAARERGLPLPEVIENLDGAAVTVAHDAIWVITRYMRGRPYSGGQARRDAAGRMLARLHARTAELPVTGPVGYDQRWDAWLQVPEETLAAARDAAGASAWHLLDPYLPHLGVLHARPPLAGDLPQAWTHGDFHGANLRMRGNRITAVLDIDTLDRRPRIYDVAYSALMLTRRGPGDYRLPSGGVTSFLAAYAGMASGLSASELDAFWPCMVLSQLPDIGHLRALREAGHPVTGALRRPMAALEALSGQHHLLTPAHLLEHRC